MRTVRFVLASIAVLFALGFGLPAVFHRLTCEDFSLPICSISPYPYVLTFLSTHRTTWLVSAVAYAAAVVLVFRGELFASFAGMSVGRKVRVVAALLALALCVLTFSVFHE
jgi:hypothetical protein